MDFAEDVHDSFPGAGGSTRPAYVWEPADAPRAVFLAVHGGMSHGRDFKTVGVYFRELGYATVSFDLTGHGADKRVQIDRFEQFLDDVSHALDWVKNRYPNVPIFMLGHSMGGLILAHFGLRRPPAPLVKGYILSSPYFENAIKVNRLVKSSSALLSALLPTMAVPLEEFTEKLTHDASITARIKQEQMQNLRATEASARFARELLEAQSAIQANFHHWQQPLLVLTAGQDYLADSTVTTRLVEQLPPEFVTLRHFPQHYHEHFNELDRRAVFEVIYDWCEQRV